MHSQLCHLLQLNVNMVSGYEHGSYIIVNCGGMICEISLSMGFVRCLRFLIQGFGKRQAIVCAGYANHRGGGGRGVGVVLRWDGV